MKILFVCSANRHRSAVAEALLRYMLPAGARTGISVSSAGVFAIPGLPALPEAVQVASEDGIDLDRHRSRCLRVEDLATTELLLVMEATHRDWVISRHPAVTERCRLLSEFVQTDAGISPGEDVPDAVGEPMAAFRRTYRIIRSCIRGLLHRLPEIPEEVYARTIEERFRRLKAGRGILSPADWQLIESWWTRGVPLWLILESMEELGKRNRPTGGGDTPRSIGYFKPIIEKRFQSYRARCLTSSRGRSSSETESSGMLQRARDLIQQAAARARSAGQLELCQLLERTGAEIPRHDSSADARALQMRLREIQKAIIDACRDILTPAQLTAMENDAADRLSVHRDRMTDAAYRLTLHRFVDRQIQELCGIPELGSL